MLVNFISILINGTVTGCLYALGAMGLVMIYKSSNVINFSHGNMAGLAAFFVFGLTSGELAQMSWAPAVLIVFCIFMVLAVAIYFFIEPLIYQSDLTATIATLGFGLIAQGVTQLIFGSQIVNLDLPIPKFSVRAAGLYFNEYYVAVVLATALMITILFFVVERTKIGIAFRAVSTNSFACRFCGLSLRKPHIFAWVVSSLLGVVAALLIVPTTFLSSTTVASFMLQAFAGAVLGGLSSLPGSAVGGILIGILTGGFAFYVAPEYTNTFILVVILFTLNVFPNGILSRRGVSRV